MLRGILGQLDTEKQHHYLQARLGYGKDKFTPHDLNWLLMMAEAWDLDLTLRELYLITVGGSPQPVVGYQVYMQKAVRSGLCEGWSLGHVPSMPEFKDGMPVPTTRAVVRIYRKDWRYPFDWEVMLREVSRKTPAWTSMPLFMLKKTALAQSFRMCFPELLGGLPYVEEEVGP